MILYKTVNQLTEWLQNRSETIGFVPTMGALHNGHLGLLEVSKKQSDITVCSIFVNPTQFNDPQDFAKYPVTLEKDLLLLEKAGCDIVFLPSVAEMYPGGTASDKHFEMGYLETILEGKYRPGHFQGVCQVVNRLLEIVRPTTLFLGQKDYQQCMVIKKLIELAGFNTALTIVPTIRENSGLALSSRNLRLSEKDKETAAVIYRSLQFLRQNIQPGDLSSYEEKARGMIMETGFEKIDYVTIADANSLEPVTLWNGQTALVALVAAFIGGIRLIDNLRLTE
jgi:pantoate--beta-alanine ligase